MDSGARRGIERFEQMSNEIQNGETVAAAALTIAQVASRLQITKQRAYALAREGKLPVVRLGVRQVRVPVCAFERFLAGASCANASPADSAGGY